MTPVADRLVKEKTDQPPYDTRPGISRRFKYRRRFAEVFYDYAKMKKIIQCADVLQTVAIDLSTARPPVLVFMIYASLA